MEAWFALTHGAANGRGPSKDHCMNDGCDIHLSCVLTAATAFSLASRAVLSPAASVQPYRFRMRQPGSTACSLASRPHDRGSPLDTSCRSISLLAWPAGRQVLFWKQIVTHGCREFAVSASRGKSACTAARSAIFKNVSPRRAVYAWCCLRASSNTDSCVHRLTLKLCNKGGQQRRDCYQVANLPAGQGSDKFC